MKNKNFYNVVNKTKLIDIFKKNKIMADTYFGQLSSNSLSLDFTKQDVYNKLVNAAPWIKTEAHDAFTLYRRDANFSQELTSEGTKLFTTGNASTDRYGMVTTTGAGLGNKISYKVHFKLNWTGSPVESADKQLITWFIGNNPTENDHTRFNVTANNGNTTITFYTVTVEGTTNRNIINTFEFDCNTNYAIELLYDFDNHTLRIFINDEPVATSPYYGGQVGYVQIGGTSQAPYKPETSFTVKSIEIKAM